MKRIKEIRFGFENCEVLALPAGSFGRFFLTDIRPEVRRVAVNMIGRYDRAHRTAIEVFRSGDREYSSFGKISSAFQRLTEYRDITSIGLLYSDGTEEEFYPVFDGEEENRFQQNHISAPGNLYILIGQDLELRDFFDPEEIEDKEDAGYWERLCRDEPLPRTVEG